MSDIASGLRLAVGTLSVVPVGAIADPTESHARWAMCLAPLAALPVAAVAASVLAVGDLAALPALVTGAMAVAAIAAGTRAMHLDGLADTVDGIGGGWTRERALEIMRRGDVGPMGVAAVVLAVLVQVAAIGALASRPFAWLLVGAAVVASRASLLLTCRAGMPSARPSGLGAVVAGSVPKPVALAGGVLLAVVMAASSAAAGLGPTAGVASAIVAVATVGLLLRTCRRVFGGVTGDIMGASIEVALGTMLLVLSSGRW
ncbi:cobalamin synthase [Knoellia sinensis KCTC 19936]|uniref:Adenosylcobinamide-GDP ribazoletransferase n=1 Tax=Knoellia sinensis KCTC 19936 TaxID=1385520 RepID=A0A0A0J5A4_9MICO|nr:adenosylcobinamide-GDP ribazoletransferase [Knoellia sinensis]KGN31924.1 cobalamin synthase [Knoellia sinensis KCTC 19936]